MLVETEGQQFLARIGFAERWLQRAKRQCQDGDVTRGALTLVLASAEMSHALKTVGSNAVVSRRWWVAPLAAAMAVAAAAAVVVSRLPVAPAPVLSAHAPVVVTLPAHFGTWLELVGVPAPLPAASVVVHAPAIPQTVRGTAVRPTATQPRVQAAPAATPPIPSQAVVTTTVALPTPTPVAVSPVPATQLGAEPALSEGDLIDLVIAAERTLRSAPPKP